MKTCVLDVVEQSPKAKEAWNKLLLEARTRKEEGSNGESVLPSTANAANNASLGAYTAQIGRMLTEQRDLFSWTVNKLQAREEEHSKLMIAHYSKTLRKTDEETNAFLGTDAFLNPGKRLDSLVPPSAPTKKQKDSPSIPLERVRVNHSRSIPDFVANYQSDLAEGDENWGHAKLQYLLGKEKKDHLVNVRQKRFQAKKNYEDLREALRGFDVDELNTRMLKKVTREATNAEKVERNVRMEIQRVATLMKNKCADLGKNASRDDISRVYAKTFEEEWPQLSTTPASGDDEMEEED